MYGIYDYLSVGTVLGNHWAARYWTSYRASVLGLWRSVGCYELYCKYGSQRRRGMHSKEMARKPTERYSTFQVRGMDTESVPRRGPTHIRPYLAGSESSVSCAWRLATARRPRPSLRRQGTLPSITPRTGHIFGNQDWRTDSAHVHAGGADIQVPRLAGAHQLTTLCWPCLPT